MAQERLHYPVLKAQMLEYLLGASDHNLYLDCTFGYGGYSRAILEYSSANKVMAVDMDPNVMEYGRKLENEYFGRFHLVHGNFADIIKLVPSQKFNGIVLDLGVSSMQLDNGSRGFSFMHDGPIDMRMSQNGPSAAEVINTISQEELANIIYEYGGEVHSRRIAKAIVDRRAIEPINSTLDLANIIRKASPARGKIDAATKTFQALRIYVNKELDNLKQFLGSLKELLLPGGRIVVISFHELEDRIVKEFFKQHSMPKVARSKYSSDRINHDDNKWLKVLTKKPVIPTQLEINENRRSRSAKLRAAQMMPLMMPLMMDMG